MKITLTENKFTLEINGKIILEHSDSKPLLYVGEGSEDVSMYRGNFKIEDYIITKIPLNLTKISENNNEYNLNFENKITADILVVDEKATIKFIKFFILVLQILGKIAKILKKLATRKWVEFPL